MIFFCFCMLQKHYNSALMIIMVLYNYVDNEKHYIIGPTIKQVLSIISYKEKKHNKITVLHKKNISKVSFSN